jgi:hypothetical protein
VQLAPSVAPRFHQCPAIVVLGRANAIRNGYKRAAVSLPHLHLHTVEELARFINCGDALLAPEAFNVI